MLMDFFWGSLGASSVCARFILPLLLIVYFWPVAIGYWLGSVLFKLFCVCLMTSTYVFYIAVLNAYTHEV